MDPKKHPDPKPLEPKKDSGPQPKQKEHKKPPKATPTKPSEPKKSDPNKDEELFKPDQTQKTLQQHPKTGHIVLEPSKKRKLDHPAPAPVPHKKNAQTSPIRDISPLPQVPQLTISPAHSPLPQFTPPPLDQEEEFDQGDEEMQLGDPRDPYSPSPDPWKQYEAPGAPDVPQEDVYPSRPSPPDDTIGFSQLLHRAAQFHWVDMHTGPIDDDFLMDTITPSQRSTVTLPMLKGVIEHAPEVFKAPLGLESSIPELKRNTNQLLLTLLILKASSPWIPWSFLMPGKGPTPKH